MSSNSVLVIDGGDAVVEVLDGTTVVEQLEQPSVIEADPDKTLVDQQAAGTIVERDSAATVLEILYVLNNEGGNPPQEEDEVYATRVDFVTDNLIYRGEAQPGTLESQAAWRIRRITIASDEDITEEWANGTSAFANIWTDRASLSYS